MDFLLDTLLDVSRWQREALERAAVTSTGLLDSFDLPEADGMSLYPTETFCELSILQKAIFIASPPSPGDGGRICASMG